MSWWRRMCCFCCADDIETGTIMNPDETNSSGDRSDASSMLRFEVETETTDTGSNAVENDLSGWSPRSSWIYADGDQYNLNNGIPSTPENILNQHNLYFGPAPTPEHTPNQHNLYYGPTPNQGTPTDPDSYDMQSFESLPDMPKFFFNSDGSYLGYEPVDNGPRNNGGANLNIQQQSQFRETYESQYIRPSITMPPLTSQTQARSSYEECLDWVKSQMNNVRKD